MKQLPPVYVNDERVLLQGDPQPKVAKIVQASGRPPRNLHVVWLRNQADATGEPVRLQDVIDRSKTGGPVYLRCMEDPDHIASSLRRPQYKGMRSSASIARGGALRNRRGGASGGHPLKEGRTDASYAPSGAAKDTQPDDTPPQAALEAFSEGETEASGGEAGLEARDASGGEALDEGADLPAKSRNQRSLPEALSDEVNSTPRERTRAMSAEREAQEDGTQRPPPT